MKKVTIEIVGGKTETVETNANTVAELMSEKGLASNYQATINGDSVQHSEALNSYDYVIFTPAVKGA